MLSKITIHKFLLLAACFGIFFMSLSPYGFAQGAFEKCHAKFFGYGKLECFTELANTGNADAEFSLGNFYYLGMGVKQDYTKARDYYQKVAEQGYPKAQYILGFLSYWGDGVKKDYAKAFEYYQKTAEQGYSLAQFQLGVLYELGQGVKQDEQQATYWLQKAAEQDAERIAEQAGVTVKKDGFPFSAQKIEQLKNLIKKANKGDVKAQTELALFYGDADWYQHLEQQANKEWGYINDRRKKDWRQALKWLQKAASKNYAEAQYQLGLGYYNGGLNLEEASLIEKGDRRDFPSLVTDNRQAFKWWLKAAQHNHAEAQNMLAYLYEEGLGVGKNIHKAVEWYKKACHNGYEEACGKTEIQDYIQYRSHDDDN